MPWRRLTATLVRYVEAKRLAVMELEDSTVLKLEDPGREDQHLEGTAAAASYSMALFLFLGRRRLPGWSVLLFLSCGSLLIEWVVLRSGESATTYTVFYFWIAIYSFQYLRVWQAFVQLAFVFLSYAVVLGLLEDPTSPQALRWALTTIALVVAGAMIGVLRHRNGRLMDALVESARIDGLTGLLNRRGFEERFSQ